MLGDISTNLAVDGKVGLEAVDNLIAQVLITILFMIKMVNLQEK
jgi:hypothetical protein